MTRSLILLAVIPLALTLQAGCASDIGTPDIGDLYSRTASHHGPDRNPVILIPGMLGSKLEDGPSGAIVWGAFDGGFADPETPEGARLAAIPMAIGRPLGDLTDEVTSTGAVGRVRLRFLGLPIHVEAYRHILTSLGIAGYRDEDLALGGEVDYGEDHFTCFQFHYDWRRDTVENARRLHRFILEKRAYVRREIRERFGVDREDIRFDIVAHSMGGLVTRYYLRYGDAELPADGSAPPVTWAGAEFVERAILVAPPNAGSAQALMNLVDGRDLGPTLPTYSPAVLGTFPALYQLLPRGRHGALVDRADPGAKVDDLLDPELWRRLSWGLAAPDQDPVLRWLLPDVPSAAGRKKVALDHQRKCLERAGRLHRALDTPATPPPGLDLALIAGDAIPTEDVLSVDRATGRIAVHGRAPGDATVTRSSALMDERRTGAWKPHLVSPIGWSQVFFIFAEHLDLTREPAFTDNLLYYLLEDPRQSARVLAVSAVE